MTKSRAARYQSKGPAEEPFRFLFASEEMLMARIRGLFTVEECQMYLEAEVHHQSRKKVVAALNKKKKELEAKGHYTEQDLPWTTEGKIKAGFTLLFGDA